jgi:hypothetical protein
MTTSESKNKNYEGKDPMSPEKITSHDPTAVKRDPNDQLQNVDRQVLILKKPKRNIEEKE